MATIGEITSVFGQTSAADQAVLQLEVRPSAGDMFSIEYGRDEVIASVRSAHEVNELGRIDGRYLSTEVAGSMT